MTDIRFVFRMGVFSAAEGNERGLEGLEFPDRDALNG
jgi:hypothetical protein